MYDNIEKNWETWYPTLCGVAHFCAATYITFFTEFKVAGSIFGQRELWSPIFALAAGATGILFSVYVFIMAPSAGFVEKISKLGIFARFRSFVANSLFLTILVTIATYPLIAARPDQFNEGWFVWLSIVSSSLAVIMALSIFRVIRIFLVWASGN